MLVNGTLTVKDIRILDSDTSYSELYNSSLYNPTSTHSGNNNKFSFYGNQNISNIATLISQNYSNIIHTEYDPVIADIYHLIGERGTLNDIAILTEYVNITQYSLNVVNNTVDDIEQEISTINTQITGLENNVFVLRNDLEDFGSNDCN